MRADCKRVTHSYCPNTWDRIPAILVPAENCSLSSRLIVEIAMICFEVSVNREVVCTAGTVEGLVHADLMQFSMDSGYSCRLKVNGIEHFPGKTALSWIESRELRFGDEIGVRIIDRPDSDTPNRTELRRLDQQRATISLCNSRSTPRVFFIEPWGRDYTLLPGDKVSLLAIGDMIMPRFELIEHDEHTSIYCNQASDFTMMQGDIELGCGHQRQEFGSSK